MLIGREEARLAAALDKLGMAPIPQQRCGPYRIDVGVWPVAVEVHTMTSSLQRVPTLMRRAAYLMEQGWAMFFLQIGRRDFHSRAPREIHQYQLDVLED